MRIILSGGGSGEKTNELDELFASMLDKSKPLLYIPIAIDKVKHPYLKCLDWLKSTFEKLGVVEYDMITESEIEALKDKLPSNFSGVYIGGGNTPYLLKQLKESGAWEFLEKALEEDIPIYGGSAGAVIFAKSIIPALYHDENKVGLEDFSGMDVIDGMEITCHYSEDQENEVIDMIKENKLSKLVALTEKNGLFAKDGVIKLIGKEGSYVFDEGKVRAISVGDVVNN